MTRPTMDPPPPVSKCPIAPDSALWNTAREVAVREFNRVGKDGNPCAAATELINTMRQSPKARLYGVDSKCEPRWSAFACLCFWYAQQPEKNRKIIRDQITKTGEAWDATVAAPTLGCAPGVKDESWCCPGKVSADLAYSKTPPALGLATCPPETPWYKKKAVIGAGLGALGAGILGAIFFGRK